MNAPRPDPFAAWKEALANAIKAKIDELLANEITGMGMAGLRNSVRIPPGGPTGTNARYFWVNNWFPEALATLPAKYQRFVLKEVK